MARQTDLESINDLLDEFDLSGNQRISTLIECLEDDEDDEETD